MKIVEISCLEVWREISNYIDEVVDPELRARMEAHFRICAHCSAILDGTRNTVKLVGDGETFELPAGFSDRLLKKIQEQ
jgi:putative zinc finger protein